MVRASATWFEDEGRNAARAVVHIILTVIPARLLYIGLIGGNYMGSDVGVMEFGIPTGIGGGYLHTSHVLLFGMAFSGIQTETDKLQTRVDDNGQINYSNPQIFTVQYMLGTSGDSSIL